MTTCHSDSVVREVTKRVLRRCELIQPKLGAYLTRRLELTPINGYADRVGDAVVLREVSGDSRGSRHRRRTQSPIQCGSRHVQPRTVGADHGCRELEQLESTRDAGFELRPNQGLEIYVQLMMTSTLTEELCMPEGSVKTVVECRHPPRDDFRLRPREPVVMLILVIHDLI